VTGPLADLRIVEISSYVATPLCGLVLRQLGADVIRVEPIGGAPDRGRFPRAPQGTSLYWSGLNAGKRDVGIDMTNPQGRALVADLICGTSQESDPGGAIVVTNTEQYAELSYDALRERRPDLVHVVLSGTRKGASAIDYTVQAATGFPAMTGPRDYVVPTNSVVPAWDISAGLYLATGLLAAVHERGRTGRGQQIRLALEDVALATAGTLGYLAEAQLSGTSRGPAGNEVYGTFGRDFVTADGVRFMLVLLTTAHWRRFLATTGLADAVQAFESTLGADFSDEAERYRYRRVIAPLVEDWCAGQPWEQVQKIMAEARALSAPYRTFGDIVADNGAEIRENPLFSEVEQPGAGAYLAPGSPLVMGGRQATAAPAPAVGQHTDEVLGALGHNADFTAQLRAAGCIA
jgi:2-methylfumaryl-CoA isomerase